MAGMLGRGRGLTVDTLEDNPVPGLVSQQTPPPTTGSPVPGSKNKSTTEFLKSNVPQTAPLATAQISVPNEPKPSVPTAPQTPSAPLAASAQSSPLSAPQPPLSDPAKPSPSSTPQPSQDATNEVSSSTQQSPISVTTQSSTQPPETVSIGQPHVEGQPLGEVANNPSAIVIPNLESKPTTDQGIPPTTEHVISQGIQQQQIPGLLHLQQDTMNSALHTGGQHQLHKTGEQQRSLTHHGKQFHHGKGDGHHKKAGHHGGGNAPHGGGNAPHGGSNAPHGGGYASHGGKHNKSRHPATEQQKVFHGSNKNNPGQNRTPYVPVLQQYQQQQHQQTDLQQLEMKEQQVKSQQQELVQIMQSQQENVNSMEPEQKELLKRQMQLHRLQGNQIKILQVQKLQLQLEGFIPQDEDQLKQKQHKMMQLQEEHIRLQQSQQQYMEEQREQQDQQQVVKQQVSDFYKSSSMSAEQIMQQFGSTQQGTICGRGKRLEELTKRAQEIARQRPSGPQLQARQHAGQISPSRVDGGYGIRMSQPGYIAKEEMGRQRLANLEEQYGGKSPNDYAFDRSNFEDRKAESGQYGPKSPQSSLSPTQRTSHRMGQPPVVDRSGNGMDTIDEIDLPPGVPTHLPPPPFMGPLDHLKLGGGYSTADMDISPFPGSGPVSQQQQPQSGGDIQYRYPGPTGQPSTEGMYYNKKGPLKSVHQLGQQHQQQGQKPHKGQQGQKGQPSAKKPFQKQQQQQGFQKQPQQQQQTASSTPPKTSLSNAEKKNEYEWQRFKIVRKIKKELESIKEGEEEETAKAIIRVMKEESQRLASFPWPKEQYVALAEVFVKAVDSCKEETWKLMVKLLMLLHKLQPDNFFDDLKKAITDKHQLYVKVSPATNAKKLCDSCVSFLLELYYTAEKAEEQVEFKETMTKFVFSLITRWISYDGEDFELGEVYYYCLMAFFREMGPKFDEETNKKFYAILRENQLRGKNRAMREGLLDLLLYQNTDWKTEPTRPEKPPEPPAETDKAPEEKQGTEEVADDAEVEPVKSEDDKEEAQQSDNKEAQEITEIPSEADTARTGPDEGSVQKQTKVPSGDESNSCEMDSMENRNTNNGSDQGMLDSSEDSQVSIEATGEFMSKDTVVKSSDQDDKDDLQSDKDDLQSDKDDLQSDRDDLQSDRDDLKSDRDDLKSHKDGLKSDKDDLKSDKNDLKSDKDDLKSDKNDLMSEKDDLTSDYPNAVTDSEQQCLDRANLSNVTSDECTKDSKDHHNIVETESTACESQLEAWNPNVPLDDESFSESADWAEDEILLEPEVSSDMGEAYDNAMADFGRDYGEAHDYAHDAEYHSTQSSGGYPYTKRSPKVEEKMLDLKITVHQSTKRDVCVLPYPESHGAGDSSNARDIPRQPTARLDYDVPSEYTSDETTSAYGVQKEYYRPLDASEMAEYGYYMRGGVDDEEWVQYNASPEQGEDPAAWFDEKIGPMLVRNTYCGPAPQIRSSLPQGASQAPVSAGCVFCGSIRHRSRECTTVKKYAPSLHIEPEPVQEELQPKRDSKFGELVYCTVCGNVGHMSYSCPERDRKPYNFFKRKHTNSYNYDYN